MASLTLLPEELLELLVTFLDGPAVAALGSTCSLLRQLSCSARVWDTLRRRSNLATSTRAMDRMVEGEEDLRARNMYFLSHKLRENWGGGRMKEMVLASEEASSDTSQYQPVSANRGLQASATCLAQVSSPLVCDPEEVLASGQWPVASGQHSLRVTHLNTGVAKEVAFNCHGFEEHFVLDDFVVLLGRFSSLGRLPRPGEPHLADVMVVSIKSSEVLMVKEAIFNIRDFMRALWKDTAVFKNTIASFRQKTITLHEVSEGDVVTRVLDVGDVVGNGVLQYSKFMAWDNQHLAHPFQAMPGNMLDDVRVEHIIFCWDQTNWQRKLFKMQLCRMNDIQQSLAVSQGRLLAVQATVLRIWDINTEQLVKTSQLELPIPVLSSFPNSFHLTEGIGMHLEPVLGLVMGVVTGHLGNRATYTLVIFNLDWQLMASMTIPEEKDLQMLQVFHIGPRLVVLYNDNSYSVVDLETLDREHHGVHWDGRTPLRVFPFPLGSAYKEGTQVSERSIQYAHMIEGVSGKTIYTNNHFDKVSEFNIVISHTKIDLEKGEKTRLVQAFSFL